MSIVPCSITRRSMLKALHSELVIKGILNVWLCLGIVTILRLYEIYWQVREAKRYRSENLKTEVSWET